MPHWWGISKRVIKPSVLIPGLPHDGLDDVGVLGAVFSEDEGLVFCDEHIVLDTDAHTPVPGWNHLVSRLHVDTCRPTNNNI